MKWEVGDTAVALYDIYKSAKHQNGAKHFKAIAKGTRLQVQEVAKLGCSIVIDVGLKEALSMKEVYCICCKCKPSHEIPAQLNKGQNLFLISRWFVKDNGDADALQSALEYAKKDPLQKRQLFLRNPLTSPEIKITAPKPVKKVYLKT